jgi:hypothetical protein
MGSLTDGLASDSKTKQIETGLAYYRAKRTEQQGIVALATKHERSMEL